MLICPCSSVPPVDYGKNDRCNMKPVHAILIAVLVAVVVVFVITSSQQRSSTTSQPGKTSVTVRNIVATTGYITGEVVSQTTVELNRLGIQFSLYDVSGAKVGNASDSIASLEPSGVWRFKASVWKPYTEYRLDGVVCEFGRIY